jgi:phosphopantothenoylcysteine decarboxylase/phosphopantothenate--cysteine ligase
LKGKTILVTAGPTREFLDPVRFLTNRSSGKMGYALAEEALRRGAKVILVSGPTPIFPPPEAAFRDVQTAEDMKREVAKYFPKADVVLMAAAVSDFTFAQTASSKIKKEKFGESIQITPAPDLLQELSRKKGSKVLVGFAAETENAVDNAIEKLKKKRLDMIVVNNVLDEGIGFESDFNRVSIVFSGGQAIQTEKMTKVEISQIILDKVEEIVGKKS